MEMLHNNWLPEGDYEYNDFDGYTLVTDDIRREELFKEEKLYHSDGDGYGPYLIKENECE